MGVYYCQTPSKCSFHFMYLEPQHQREIGGKRVEGKKERNLRKPNAIFGPCLEPDSNQPTIKTHF